MVQPKNYLLYFKGKDIDEPFLKELKELDAKTYAPLTVNEDHLNSLLQNNPNLQEKWSQVCFTFQKIQMETPWKVYPFPSEEEVEKLLEHGSCFQITDYLKYLSKNAYYKLKDNIMKKKNSYGIEDRIAQLNERKKSIHYYGLGGNNILIKLFPNTVNM